MRATTGSGGLSCAFACAVAATSCTGGAPHHGASHPSAPFTAEQKAEHYFEGVREQPLLLAAFLTQMPKGGDLHSHVTGAVYAESLVAYAAKDGLCVDPKTMTLLPPPCEGDGVVAAKRAISEDPALFRKLVEAFSMMEFQEGHASPKNHFFDAFTKFEAATRGHMGDMIAEVAQRAASQNESYLELSLRLDHGVAATLGAKQAWDDDFARMREALLAGGVKDASDKARKTLDDADAAARALMKCDHERTPGCDVIVRYIYEVRRDLPKEQVFAQMLAGFEAAQASPRLVGITLVQPEDGYVAMTDYHLHMRMLDFFHKLYPRVHITLHAGELVPGIVPREALRFHVREAVELGHAERIAHAVDAMYEDRALDLVRDLAKKKVAVEVCLTSNDIILGVEANDHPFPLFLHYGVPVALTTDDEGVSRTDLTNEFVRAVQTYGIGYGELKGIARTSLEKSFLPGESLWAEGVSFRRVAACATQPAADAPTGACAELLARSERAKLEWDLERRIAKFEAQY